MTAAPRIVVVKLAALGDVVMASTLVEAIRARWPGAHLTWVTGAPFAPLVSCWAGVDRVVPVDTARLLRGGLGARVRALWNVWRALGGPLGGLAYDLGLIAHTDVRYNALLWGVRVRERRALRPGRPSAVAGVLGYSGDWQRGARPGQWMGAEYARMVMDPAADDGQPEASAPALARLVLADGLIAAGERAEGTVVLAPGGARNLMRDDPLRRWPIAHWVELARALREAGHRVVLVGGTDDLPESQAITAEVPGVESLVGRTALMELVALVARARVVVTHDSGVLHLALLTNTNTVALFGPTAPDERLPFQARVVVASAARGLPCAPCYDGRVYAPCVVNRCLTDLSPEKVWGLVVNQFAL